MLQKRQSGNLGFELDGEDNQTSDDTPRDAMLQRNSQPGETSGLLPLAGDLGVVFQAPTSGDAGTGSSSGSSPTTGVNSNTSPFVINVTYDQSQSSLPTGFVAAINYVVNYYESIFTNPSTVNIDVGYGTIDGQPLQSGALGESESFLATYNYSTIKTALNNIDPSAASSLPSSAPGNMWVATAEAKALGLSLQQPSTDIDGYAGFSNAFPFTYDPNNQAVSGEYDFIGVVEHEFSEVMGRIDLFGQTIGSTQNSYSLLDMFHYTAPGTHTYTGTTTNYFSVDGGTTNLDNFNTKPSGDLGDWASSAGHDAYLAFSPSGHANTVSPSDIAEMNALGYATTPPQPDLIGYLNMSNVTAAAGASVAIDEYVFNFGAGVAGASSVGLYLSTDSTITTADTLLATHSTPALSADGVTGYYDDQKFSVALPGTLAPGTYYLGAIADNANQVTESNENNNNYNVVQVTVPGPDLIGYLNMSNVTAAAGASVAIDEYVFNFGNGAAGASSVGLYLSTDSTITTADTLLATHSTPALSADGVTGYYDDQKFSVALPGTLAPGTYYLGAIADNAGQVIESNENNNNYNVVQLTVPTLTQAVNMTGMPQLVDSSNFTGTVAGMSGEAINGANSANISLLGNYLASSFVTSYGGHGSAPIVDPPGSALSQNTLIGSSQHV
jgi:hypothetical protein